MLETDEKATIEKGMMTLWGIWAAILGSLGVYLLVCYHLGENLRYTPQPDSFGLFRNIISVIAFTTLLLSFFFRRYILKNRSSGSGLRLSRSPALLSQPLFLAKYSSAVIVSLALSESVGIYGLVLFYTGRELPLLYLFITVSALAMYFHRPKTDELERLAQAMKQEVPSGAALVYGGWK
jgi:hypothetical protein